MTNAMGGNMGAGLAGAGNFGNFGTTGGMAGPGPNNASQPQVQPRYRNPGAPSDGLGDMFGGKKQEKPK